MPISLVLFCRGGVSREAYLAALSALDVEVEVAETVATCHAALASRPRHGVLIDMPTRIGTSDEQRRCLQLSLERMAVLHVRHHQSTGRILAMAMGDDSVESLEQFIETRCRHAVPQQARAHERIALVLPVRYCVDETYDDAAARRSVTTDISKGGMFLFTCDPLEPGKTLSLTLPALDDQTPIRAEVRWVLPWGVPGRMPGAGLMFTAVTDDQLRDLNQRFGIR